MNVVVTGSTITFPEKENGINLCFIMKHSKRNYDSTVEKHDNSSMFSKLQGFIKDLNSIRLHVHKII